MIDIQSINERRNKHKRYIHLKVSQQIVYTTQESNIQGPAIDAFSD